jgi:TDG/mug DNA glycosylase family protein
LALTVGEPPRGVPGYGATVALPRPTREELERARSKTVPDVLGPDLGVVFCGINPGLYSAATGHHFARPGNRFWKALHRSGWTDRVLNPSEDGSLPTFGVGVTNLVDRATATAAELDSAELAAGGESLRAKAVRIGPRAVAILGVTAYRRAFSRPRAPLGLQPEGIGQSVLWVLPNPSGLNAHHQMDDLTDRFARLREMFGG